MKINTIYNKKNNFIEKSKRVHGDLYDYSLVIYNGCKEKVKIICRKHGIFEQTPTQHLVNGCKRCVDDLKMMNKEDFIEKSKRVHGDLYDYSLVIYNGCKEKVKIICRKHGIFEQTPDNHIRKRGCPICNVSKKSNNNNFILNSRKIHGDLYDYSLVEYKNSKEKVKIICKKHGVFEQTPNNHLRGQSCPICKSLQKIKSQLDFLSDCVKSHNYTYDYSLVKYLGVNKKIKIICKKHGVFEQKPNNHLRGQGCPICKNSKVK